MANPYTYCDNCQAEIRLDSNTDDHCPDCGEELDLDQAYESDLDEDHDLIDGVGFADPGGRSALRAETEDNPRNLPCPNCGRPNMLTPADRAHNYQCDACADALERGGY